MKAFASTNAAENKAANHQARTRGQAERDLDFAHSSYTSPTIFRKSSCACGGGCPTCQGPLTGLRVSKPDDPAEIEADAIADTVMRMPATETASPSVTSRTSDSDTVHAKCSECEDEEIPETLMRKEAFASGEPDPPDDGPPDDGLSSVRSVINSGGYPLDTGSRSFFEPRFGIDLGHVRVHTDGAASNSARAIRARAYTLGSSIVFGSGEYRPSQQGGKELLAHELAHVAQFSGHSPVVNRSVIYRDTEAFDDNFEQPSGGESQSTNAAAQKPDCPAVPTGLGDQPLNPSCPKATHTGLNELARVHFCLDSDKPNSQDEVDKLKKDIAKMHKKTHFLVHGFASTEGRVNYNFNLACHRANHVAGEMKTVISPTPTTIRNETDYKDRLETATQGPTTQFGSPADNRVVVVYAQSPGVGEDSEPGCDKAPRGIGNVQPEIGCDVQTIDIVKTGGSDHKTQFRFCLDSDVLADVQPKEIHNFAHAQASKAIYYIHGFSSEEGAANYNQRLSCHRAQRIARELGNANVNADHIREVSGLGETKQFGDADFNRTAVVYAEGGEVDPLKGGTRGGNKTAVKDEALKRLLSGRYLQAADSYISYWTCGRTRTVRQGVDRLTINMPKESDKESSREAADGVEEGYGLNLVTLSNAALGADNAVECTMGRLVDMAFHNAVLGNPDLPNDLTTKWDPNARVDDPDRDPNNKAARHDAGLYLIHLAGLGACTGKTANPTTRHGNAITGISKPLDDDPRAEMPPPSCAETPQPTRLQTPVKGAKERETPGFTWVAPPQYTPADGKLRTTFSNGILITRPVTDMLTASAEVQLSGKSDTFPDYEVGFIQSVISDGSRADYDSGHSALHELPVPIRMAELISDIPVPAPWTTLNSMKPVGADGKAAVTTSGIGLNSLGAMLVNGIKAALPYGVMYDLGHSSRIAIWLVARRRGAPLDRFSVHFIDGATYDLTQTFHFEHRRVKGGFGEPTQNAGEHDLPIHIGDFHTSKPTDLPADPSQAQFGSPTAADIPFSSQFKKLNDPPEPPANALDEPGLIATIADILDQIKMYDSDEDARKGTGGKPMPRLGFDFIPLEIDMPFVRQSGRLVSAPPKVTVIKVSGEGLNSAAAKELATALEYRISDRTHDGKSVIVKRSIIPGTKEEESGTVHITIPPRSRKPDDPVEMDGDLTKQPQVLHDMAEAWECTLKTGTAEFVYFGQREFGRTYSMDRYRKLTPFPASHLTMGKEEMGGVYETKLICPAHPPSVPEGYKPAENVTLGGFHTHPEVEIPPKPSEEDTNFVKKCGGAQYFIVTDYRVFRFDKKGVVTPVNVTLQKGVRCRNENLEEIKILGQSVDDD